ncbi:hypothetical protein BY996DRAFT_8685198 [Phakopsora pachyrhizi]|nr:hypothetical protein BY996DRAFT_8685198 [Phakopsora pachyrhizi]
MFSEEGIFWKHGMEDIIGRRVWVGEAIHKFSILDSDGRKKRVKISKLAVLLALSTLKKISQVLVIYPLRHANSRTPSEKASRATSVNSERLQQSLLRCNLPLGILSHCHNAQKAAGIRQTQLQAAQKSRLQQKREAKYADALKKGTHVKPSYRDAKANKPAVSPSIVYGFLALLGGGIEMKIEYILRPNTAHLS